MTVAASDSIVAWGIQNEKGAVPATWYRHKVTRADFGGLQDIRPFPPEIGGGFHPTGAYKRFGAGGGTFIMHPRLQDVFGWMVLGAVGTCSASDGTGPYTHTFSPPSVASQMPWMGYRKLVAAADDADRLGETLLDGRTIGLRIACPAGEIAEAAATVVARIPEGTQTGLGDWTWGNEYEEYVGVPIAPKGLVELGGQFQPALNIIIDLVNDFTSIEEELVVGSYHPDDFILQQQIVTVRWTYKWQDADLYRAIFYGDNAEVGGVIGWSPEVHTDSFKLRVESPGDITGEDEPWALEFEADEITWQADPPVLVGGGWLAQEYIGVVQEHVTPEQTFSFTIVNNTADYEYGTP